MTTSSEGCGEPRFAERMTALLFGALALLLFSAGILRGSAPVFRDLLVLVIPLRHTARAAVRAGTIPLWSDGLFFGAPFLANYQSGVFYPPSLIIYVLPFPLGLDLFLAFHVFVAGWGTARYLADGHRLEPIESAFGGIVFAFGGFLTSLVSLTNQLCAAAWLPWAAWVAQRLMDQGRTRDFVLLTAIFFLQALSGAPEAWLMTTILVLALAARELRSSRARLSRFGRALASVLFAAGLSAFQLLPTAEYAATTDRSSGLPLHVVTEESLEPLSLLQFLLPHTFSASAPDFVPEGGVPLFWSLYIGIASLVLAIAALPRQPFWAGALVLSLMLSMGPSTPLFPFLHGAVPRLVGLFRFPAKLFLISHFALAILAAHGLSMATRARAAGRFVSWVWIAIALAGLGVAFTAGQAPHRLLEIIGFRTVTPLSTAAATVLASHLALVALRTALLALVSLGVVRQVQRGRVGQAGAATVIASLTALELILVHRPVHVFVDWSALDAPAAGRVRPGERIFHYRKPAGELGLEPWIGALQPGEDVTERARSLWSSLVPDAPMVYGATAVAGSDGFLTRSQRDLFRILADLPRDRAVHLLAALGVHRLIGTEPLGEALTPVEPRAEGAAPWEYTLEGRAPRIYLADHVFHATDRSAALLRAAEPDFRPGRDAVLNVEAPTATGGRGIVRRASFEPGRITADLSLESPALCVVSDTWLEGWEATIDGEPATIWVANGLMRGVGVPEGSHSLEMRYRPRSLRLGWRISAVAIIAFGAILFCDRVRTIPIPSRTFTGT
jgi:hypothetical protein